MTHWIGLVGAGMIAPIHMLAIDSLPDATLAGIMDNGSGRGRELAREMVPDIDHRGSDDIDVFLARDDIDVVAIATPSGAHMDVAIKAAEAGKHCLVEKPMDVRLARIDAMIRAHEKAGTYLGGIFNTRYTEPVQRLKSAVAAGRFGRLTFASAVGPWWRTQAYYDESGWKGTIALDGGGALMNQGIHSVDLLQWLAGSPVVELSGRVATLAHERIEVEDTAAASLTFANGALGTIACTTSMWPGHFRTITIAGTDGTVVLADNNFMIWRFRDERPEDRETAERFGGLPGTGIGASDPSAGVDAEGHRAAYRDFLDAVENGSQPEVDGREARKAVAIILAIYRSSANGGAPVQVV